MRSSVLWCVVVSLVLLAGCHKRQQFGPTVETIPIAEAQPVTDAGLAVLAEEQPQTPEPPNCVTVLFDFDDARLRAQEIPALDRFAVSVRGPVEVVGGACPIGDGQYNDKLSERRARVVAHHLRQMGVNVVSVRWCGEACLVATEPQQYERNRRAEVSVWQ